MPRTYSMTRRADAQAETRRKIVEAAVNLHGTIGPARTTISMVAERAGVQRHTLYAHFPDERSLFIACSGHAMARDPVPDPAVWRTIPDRAARLRRGLGELYGWFGRNADLIACIERDHDVMPIVQEVQTMRYRPFVEAALATLGEGLFPPQIALLTLAMNFATWRSLTRDAGLDSTAAADLMASAILRAAD